MHVSNKVTHDIMQITIEKYWENFNFTLISIIICNNLDIIKMLKNEIHPTLNTISSPDY